MSRMTRKETIQRRHRRLRVKVHGTAERPRMAVFRSNKHLYVQLVDDEGGTTVVAVSTVQKAVAEKSTGLKGLEKAKLIGATVGELALSRGIKHVVFDRGGFTYSGRIKSLADAAREKGLQF